MTPVEVKASKSSITGRLTHTRITPIDLNLLQCETYNFISLGDSTISPYRVGANDVLSVVIWNHPELSVSASQTDILSSAGTSIKSNFSSAPQGNGIIVDASGKIFFPFVGDVFVSGKTTGQVEKILAKSLSRYIRNPQLAVRVIGYNSQRVNVIGEVKTPGTQALTGRPMSLLDALSAAGGIDTNIADAGHMYVFRNDMGRISVYWLNGRSPQALLLAQRFRLANNDIVYVAPSTLPSWNRILAQLLPTIQAIWYTRSLIRD
jgi:protein involved in polysaccharide export with SLBB domain